MNQVWMHQYSSFLNTRSHSSQLTLSYDIHGGLNFFPIKLPLSVYYGRLFKYCLGGLRCRIKSHKLERPEVESLT